MQLRVPSFAISVKTSFAIKTSVVAISAALSSPALAQCAPDPTVTDGVTTCSGNDPDGLRVTTHRTTVNVASGATVSGENASAITIETPVELNYEPDVQTINVHGRVDGQNQSGIKLFSGTLETPDSYFYQTVRLNLGVTEGGIVSGTTALSMESSAGNSLSTFFASVDNSGTMSGSSGIALMASERSGFESIVNRSSGVIGAIRGQVGALSNAGLIDGGTSSAIDASTSINIGVGWDAWVNTGTIRSASSEATVLNFFSLSPLENSGLIANSGTGAAIAARSATVTNLTNGQIMSADGPAMQISNGLTLTNLGTITGDVIVSNEFGFFSSLIDTTRGTINGNVILSGSNDVVVAKYAGSPTPVTGITGDLIVGGGTNSIQMDFDADGSLFTPIDLPMGFQRLRLNVAEGVTATLDDGFVSPGAIDLFGSGTIVNRTAIDAAGTTINAGLYVGDPSFVNEGSITATPAQTWQTAITFSSGGTFTNRGVIDVDGYGVAMLSGSFSNSGTIIATNTGVSASQIPFDNSGLIRSTGGTALEISGNVGISATNSGQIEGASVGVSNGIALSNSGTISSPGIGVLLQSYGIINNLADGVIDGGTYAIRADMGGNQRIINAGVINGDVLLTSVSPRTNGRFYAVSGGMLNGNLTLGDGDLFVTDFVNTGPGAFAGVSGTVTGNGALLRYRISNDTTTSLNSVGAFHNIGFEVAKDTTLNLTAPSTWTEPLTVSGSGTVNLDAVIITTDAAALTIETDVYPDVLAPTPASQELTVNTAGTLSFTRMSPSGDLAAVYLNAQNRLQNTGTISVIDATAQATPYTAAIVGGREVVNDGVICIDSGLGITNAATVINNGTIAQVGGTVASIGLRDVATIDNRGTVDVAGYAVAVAQSITNSGTIVSRQTVAIASDYGMDINNQTGGTISSGAGASAIRMNGGSLSNAGMINGDLELGYSPYSNVSGQVSIRNAGTVQGNVFLGTQDDSYVYVSGSLVTGIVRGGEGIDTLGFDLTGIDETPETLDLSGYEDFERLDVESGTGKIEGEASFQQITVSGGRLIGAVGSTLTAEELVVVSDGTFGSAGTVNGNVTVAGTLSPGASPGTMTINGNVSLASGSTTLFEMTPTVSDAIVIDGALAIASGATLKLTGDRPLMPGTSYNLITASDGITGSFSTIDKAATVLGYIRQGANSIELLGQFVLDPEAVTDPQAARVTAHLNDLLIGGTATAGIVDLVPLLIDADGFGDATRLKQVSPEAYASASQMGIENGLALAAAGRTMNLANGRAEAALFTFGQWLGNWRRMPGHEGLGTARASINTRGVVGGIGYGSQNASVGAFVGYIDAKQRIGALGAVTDSDGVVAGIIGQAKMGGAEFTILTAFDGSKAETSRALPDGDTARGRYDMHGWTTDATIGYAADIGDGWNLKPSVGVTHVRSVRQGAVESGGSPLALTVAGRTAKATFLNADLMIRGNPEARLQPWLSAGVRHQANGNLQVAGAALTGTATAFSVPGAPRDKTQATISAGLGAALTPMATLFFGVSSEFGADTSGQSANAGLKMRF